MWPKGPTYWIENRLLRVSIPFTWNLPEVKAELSQINLYWDRAEVGGPAVELMPGFFDGMEWVTVGKECPGVLQMVNPLATRTTTGCPNTCGFCGVPTIEPIWEELEEWPEGWVLCDNNLLAASERHIERVFSKLIDNGQADFNQGLDARRMTDDHAHMLSKIKEPVIRLAMDHMGMKEEWSQAYERLRSAGIAKRKIRSYCLVGFNSDPSEAWERCKWVESHGVAALPMWFHPLDAMKENQVTEKQEELGWNDYERRRIMQWFYFHKEAVK